MKKIKCLLVFICLFAMVGCVSDESSIIEGLYVHESRDEQNQIISAQFEFYKDGTVKFGYGGNWKHDGTYEKENDTIYLLDFNIEFDNAISQLEVDFSTDYSFFNITNEIVEGDEHASYWPMEQVEPRTYHKR